MPIHAQDMLRLRLRPADGPQVRRRFVEGFGRTAGAVTVVTTDGVAGRFGQTATAAMSVSADPPTLIVGLYREVPVADAVRTNGVFAVNVLSVGDIQVARDFAGQSTFATRYKFGDDWSVARTGSPVRTSAAAVFDCHVEQTLVAGSHLLIIGRVIDGMTNDVDCLTYANRTYGHHTALPA